MKGNAGTLKVALVVLALGMMAVVSLVFKTGMAGAAPKEIPPDSSQDMSSEALEPGGDLDREFPVPIKPLPKTITPCRACHGPEKDFPVNFKRREALLVHRNVKLNHGGVRVWCLDCHDPVNRNYLLPLSDGKLDRFRSFVPSLRQVSRNEVPRLEKRHSRKENWLLERRKETISCA